MRIGARASKLSVSFTLPEKDLALVLERYRSGAKLPVQAWNRGDTQELATGVLSSIDNQIEITTGTLKFKALFDNRDQVLVPNQFVNVHLLADTLKNGILAPTAAIQYGTNGSFVYAMDGDKKVKIRSIKVGVTDGDVTGTTGLTGKNYMIAAFSTACNPNLRNEEAIFTDFNIVP